MRISLYRDTLTPQATTGKLYLEGNFSCFVLELPLRDGKPGSAIPAGVYPIELAPSPKFLANPDPWVQNYANRMPHVMDIPGRSLIMLHWGNEPTDTDGCLLVGKSRLINYISESRLAFQQLYPLIEVACGTPEGANIAIFDPPAQPPIGLTADLAE